MADYVKAHADMVGLLMGHLAQQYIGRISWHSPTDDTVWQALCLVDIWSRLVGKDQEAAVPTIEQVDAILETRCDETVDLRFTDIAGLVWWAYERSPFARLMHAFTPVSPIRPHQSTAASCFQPLSNCSAA